MKNPYRTCSVSQEELSKINDLREAFLKLHELIENLCPKSREQSVVFTHLETAAMWATKAISHNGSGSGAG